MLGLTKHLSSAGVAGRDLGGSDDQAAVAAAAAQRQHQAVQWQSQRGFCEGELRVV